MTANPPFRTIQLQRDTAANWTSANTLLAEGELGLEMDTRKAKIGDWVTNWNSLSYAFSWVGGGDMLKSDNLSWLADYAVARSNMGLGSLATQSGTFSWSSSWTNTWDEPNASLTVEGIVELATTAEINTGTDTTRAMPVDQFVASTRNVRYFDIYAIEKATDNAVGNNIAWAFECPFTWTITEIGAYVETAWVTWASVWDVNKNGTTIMTTNKLSIDTAEVSTRTAATAPTLTTTAITAGDLITIDTDSLSTTKPKGLHVRIWIRLT